jgi:hypothetical protein
MFLVRFLKNFGNYTPKDTYKVELQKNPSLSIQEKFPNDKAFDGLKLPSPSGRAGQGLGAGESKVILPIRMLSALRPPDKRQCFWIHIPSLSLFKKAKNIKRFPISKKTVKVLAQSIEFVYTIYIYFLTGDFYGKTNHSCSWHRTQGTIP